MRVNIARPIALAGLLLAAALLAGCSSCGDLMGFFVEPRPDIDNPKQYARGGVSFSYPGNWKLTESSFTEAGLGVHIVEIESKGNALIAVQIFTPAVPLDLHELLDEVTTAMHQEVAQLTGGLMQSSDMATNQTSRQLLGATRQGLQRRLTIDVLGERVPHTMEIYGVELAQMSLVTITSGADEDLPKINPGYALVLDSLQVIDQPTVPAAPAAQSF